MTKSQVYVLVYTYLCFVCVCEFVFSCVHVCFCGCVYMQRPAQKLACFLSLLALVFQVVFDLCMKIPLNVFLSFVDFWGMYVWMCPYIRLDMCLDICFNTCFNICLNMCLYVFSDVCTHHTFSVSLCTCYPSRDQACFSACPFLYFRKIVFFVL